MEARPRRYDRRRGGTSTAGVVLAAAAAVSALSESRGFCLQRPGHLRRIRAGGHIWTEITTLVIPGENEVEIAAEAAWIALELGPDAPLHPTAFCRPAPVLLLVS